MSGLMDVQKVFGGPRAAPGVAASAGCRVSPVALNAGAAEGIFEWGGGTNLRGPPLGAEGPPIFLACTVSTSGIFRGKSIWGLAKQFARAP